MEIKSGAYFVSKLVVPGLVTDDTARKKNIQVINPYKISNRLV